MRIIIFSALLLFSSIMFFGCTGNDSPSVPEPPSSPILEINDDDYSVTISWMQSPSVVEGYRVRFDNELIADVPSSQTSIIDTPEYLGTYAVSAYDANSESEARFVDLPSAKTFSYDFSLQAKALCAFRIDTIPERYIIIRYTGDYGDSTNEYYADSIDFYLDTLFMLCSPRKIVDEGRWSDAFHTKFKKLGSGLSENALDSLQTLTPFYETDSSFTDYVQIEGAGDLIEIVIFRQNEPAHSVEKTYSVIYVISKNDDDFTVGFDLKFQPTKNFCVIGENP